MIYLVAMVVAIGVALLAWRAFGPERDVPTSSRRGPIGPDDDVDFLQRLDRDHHSSGRDSAADSGESEDPRTGP